MKESLPLFNERQETQESRPRGGLRAGTPPGGSRPVGKERHPDDLHMEAARRLAREFKRSKVKAPDRVRTGRLICRHLVAMLHDIELDADGH
jgi:hypothetical protein